jgi:NhaP-type Na+/H+ or K+/H+ antiporter
MPAVAVVVFAAVLLAAVLVSELAHRTVLSAAVLFLVAGFLVGEGMLGLVPLRATDPIVALIAELALFTVLFTDGMRIGVRDLAAAWRLPGRALLFGLPLTLVGTALVAHWVAGVPWAESFLLGAVLSPTDPVFAAAIVGREEIPRRLRHLLNVESGLNDGLALPIVVVLLALAGRDELRAGELAGELVLGVVIGVVVPLVAIWLEHTRLFAAARTYQPLGAFAIGLLVLGVGLLTHANLFLAAFAAGITVASADPEARDEFHAFGELIGELLKLAALLVFGALMSPAFLAEVPASGWVFAVLAIVAVRPLSIVIALAGAHLPWRELGAAAWFGPKGFASVVYGLLVLGAGLPRSDQLFHLIAVVIVLSILAHSSTDVLVARLFHEPEEPPPAGSEAAEDARELAEPHPEPEAGTGAGPAAPARPEEG